MDNTLLLVDGSSYLYRAYHAMAPLTAPDGTPTGAVYGVLNMLRRLRLDVPHRLACCVFDAKGENFRHALYPQYKANRPPMPDDLRPQADMLPELVRLLGWPVLQVPGVEADDVIGTLCAQAEQSGMKVVVSTGDKDMAQLVNAQVSLVNTMTGEVLDSAGVEEKFGVRPDQIRDYLTLVGDKVDNVPGVDKCGPKTAVKWLAEYGSLSNVMAHAADIKGKIGENLQVALAHLPLSYDLVTIRTNLDLGGELPQGLDDLARTAPQWAVLTERFQALNFRGWLKEAQAHLSENGVQAATTPDAPDAGIQAAEPRFTAPAGDLFAAQPDAAVPPDAPVELNYRAVTTQAQLDEIVQRLQAAEFIGLDTETTSLDAMQAQLVGISIALAAGDAVYIPVGHTPAAAPEQLPCDTVLGCLKPFLEAEKPVKIGQNLKYDQHVFANCGIVLGGIGGDAMLASYLLESHLGHGLDELAQRHLGITAISYEDVCGKGAKQIGFADVDLDTATRYAAEDADLALRLERLLRSRMNEKLLHLYTHIELPVAQVLFGMERNGVLISRTELSRQSHELGSELMRLQERAYELAGQPFNLNSPKQLQEILFDKMGIPTKGLKKTASGGVSTNEAVLEKLAPDYPLPALILQTRGLAKLKSTYTDKLPEMIDAATGRVHTTYAQAVAVTGRLASNNPNLQNIPVRTEEGRRVRRAFIAPPDAVIVSADYSQIELRIMAHLSGDKTLIQAFGNGEDVHRRTAAEIFGIAPEAVSAEQRRYAKTINFGLIYGMSEFGLAKALHISNDAARNFKDRYFARYTGVAEYMQRTNEQAHRFGYVETLFGRRLYLPGLNSKKAPERMAAERTAINAPLQGTASDLIKLAMIAVGRWLAQQQLRSRLIMQVHDELVLEVPHTERDTVCAALPELMANVAQLHVPLLAEVGCGSNWEEAH